MTYRTITIRTTNKATVGIVKKSATYLITTDRTQARALFNRCRAKGVSVFVDYFGQK